MAGHFADEQRNLLSDGRARTDGSKFPAKTGSILTDAGKQLEARLIRLPLYSRLHRKLVESMLMHTWLETVRTGRISDGRIKSRAHYLRASVGIRYFEGHKN